MDFEAVELEEPATDASILFVKPRRRLSQLQQNLTQADISQPQTTLRTYSPIEQQQNKVTEPISPDLEASNKYLSILPQKIVTSAGANTALSNIKLPAQRDLLQLDSISSILNKSLVETSERLQGSAMNIVINNTGQIIDTSVTSFFNEINQMPVIDNSSMIPMVYNDNISADQPDPILRIVTSPVISNIEGKQPMESQKNISSVRDFKSESHIFFL